MALREAMCFWTSFFDRGMERGLTTVRLKTTRLAAVFIQALLPSDFIGSECNGAEGLSSCFGFVVADCLEEEKVGVMKCGDSARFSLPSIVGDCNGRYPNDEYERRLTVFVA